MMSQTSEAGKNLVIYYISPRVHQRQSMSFFFAFCCSTWLKLQQALEAENSSCRVNILLDIIGIVYMLFILPCCKHFMMFI